MAQSFFEIAALQVVIDTKIEDLLVKHPQGLSAAKIAEATGTEEGKIARILRYLASRHVFREVDTNVFASNRLSRPLGSGAKDGSVGNLISHWHYDVFACGSTFATTICDPKLGKDLSPKGAPVAQHFGADSVFEFFGKEPTRGARFARSMPEVIRALGYQSLGEDYPWIQEFGEEATFIDVGGNIGTAAKNVASKCPKWKFVVQDLKEGIAEAPAFWKDKPDVKVEFELQDFFTPQPASRHGANVYFLRAIIHDWPDAECIKILKHLRDAASPKSRLIVDEFLVLPATAKKDPLLLDNAGYGSRFTGSIDMTMLACLNAQERTREQFEKLFEAGGWKLVKETPLKNRSRFLIEGVPA